jgi:hypothetical protein
MAGLYYLEAVVQLPCEARLNDIPLDHFDARGAEYRAFLPVPGLLRRGDNRLAVRLDQPFAPPPPPPPGQPPEIRTWVDLRVAEFADGDEGFAGDGRTLAHIEWTPRAGEQQHEVRFAMADAPAGWSVPRCEPLDLSAATLAAAQAFLQGLHAAYMALQPGPILAASRVRIADLAPAYGLSPAQFEGKLAAAITSDGPVRAAPPVDFAPRLCGDGRLLQCLGRDGRPWIRGVDAEGDMDFMKAVIGRIDGAWAIVR